MCIKCYRATTLHQKVNTLTECISDENYDFTKWNSTSLTFLYLMLCDSSIEDHHHMIVQIYSVINKNKSSILDSINSNSHSKIAYDIFDIIGKIICQK